MEEIPVITDFCLHIQHAVVQASGKALTSMVLQECARTVGPTIGHPGPPI